MSLLSLVSEDMQFNRIDYSFLHKVPRYSRALRVVIQPFLISFEWKPHGLLGSLVKNLSNSCLII